MGKKRRDFAKRKIKETRTKDVVDRFSDLPDHVILKILSSIPFKEAVQTCILSSRWTDVLTNISDIRLDPCRLISVAKRLSFMNFVDGFLSSRKDTIVDRFLLHCKDMLDPCRINGWIQYALRHGVKELDLAGLFDGLQFRGVFTSKTLVTLRLKVAPMCVSVPTNCALPNLKVLILTVLIIPDRGQSFRRLISSCTSLEELYVQQLAWKLIVCNPHLKRLTIVAHTIGYRLEINTPNLVYFKLASICWIPLNHSFTNLASLLEAQISVGQQLESSDYFVEWVNMLENCPRLETLGFDFRGRGPGNLHMGKDLPSCLVHHVKKIKFTFYGEEFEFRLLQHLLDKAEALERLTIEIKMKERKKEKMKMVEEIGQLPKVSNKCQIFIQY